MNMNFLHHAAVCLALSLSLTGLTGTVDAALNFDASLVQLSRRAYDLSVAAYREGNGISAGSYYRDGGTDAAFFLQENNICWASFRGTEFTNLEDVLQNLNPANDQICPPSGPCCTARAGFVQGYNGVSYYTTLFNQLHDCKTSCPDCQVILTGHSQGAAIAAVAAVDLADLNPQIITFGQPASIIGSCAAIDVNRYYRFVNTDNQSAGDFDYDPVPCLNLNADQMGYLIFLGNDGNNVAVYDHGNSPDISAADWDFLAHFLADYGSRIYGLNTNGVATNGFIEGSGCNFNSECRLPARCVDGDNVCSSGANGDPCNGNGDCDSGRCEGILTGLFSGTCEAKLGRNRGCNEDSDCINGNCRFPFFRCN